MTAQAARPARETDDGLRLVEHALEVLTRERAAIAALDAEELAAIAETKRGLAASLRSLQHELAGSPPTSLARGSLARSLREVHAQALANALLLEDVSVTIAGTLGIAESTFTYDRRARTTGYSRRSPTPAHGRTV
ncbi:MAG: hypothetical protein V2A73_07030 [Pseudomonadota bacterium]